MPPTLYVDIRSQPCRAVVIFCKKNGIKFEQRNVDLFKGEQKSDWFTKKNPMRAVPALEDGDFLLTEGAAILHYLARTNKVAAHWYPENAQQRARVDEYISWHNASGGMRANGAGFFIERLLSPMMSGKPVNKEEVEKKRKSLDAALDQFSDYFLSRGPFIAGSDITLADLMAVCEVSQPLAAEFDVKQRHPRVAAWLDDVKAKLEPELSDVTKTVNDFAAQKLSPLE